jgi:hypothetical protein
MWIKTYLLIREVLFVSVESHENWGAGSDLCTSVLWPLQLNSGLVGSSKSVTNLCFKQKYCSMLTRCKVTIL